MLAVLGWTWVWACAEDWQRVVGSRLAVKPLTQQRGTLFSQHSCQTWPLIPHRRTGEWRGGGGGGKRDRQTNGRPRGLEAHVKSRVLNFPDS